MALSLSSTAFQKNELIPARHGCDGEDIAPPLDWSDAPSETQSFALVCTDPDAPGGVFHHWAVYDIPADAHGLPAGYNARKSSDGAKEAKNDFGKTGYGGPCPPREHGLHHYYFRLSALDTPTLSLTAGASCKDVIDAARRHVIESAELVGVYER